MAGVGEAVCVSMPPACFCCGGVFGADLTTAAHGVLGAVTAGLGARSCDIACVVCGWWFALKDAEPTRFLYASAALFIGWCNHLGVVLGCWRCVVGCLILIGASHPVAYTNDNVGVRVPVVPLYQGYTYALALAIESNRPRSALFEAQGGNAAIDWVVLG